MRLLIYLFISLLSLYGYSAQSSLSSCKFNGVDYSFLANSTSYSTTDSSGLYTYYFNICKTSSKCNSFSNGNVVACQTKTIAPNQITAIGVIGQGTFGKSNNGVVLNYRTNANPCSSGYRNFDIYFAPNNNGIKSISQVYEESKCTYGVTISYQNPSSSSDSCESEKNGKIVVENENNGLFIQSFTDINCISSGQTYCVDGKGSICQNGSSSQINCSSNDTNLIVCSSSNIICMSDGNSFSLFAGQLYVNGRSTNEKVVVLNANGCNS